VYDGLPIVSLPGKLRLILRHLAFGVLLGADRLHLRLGVHFGRIEREDAAANQERAWVLQPIIEEAADDVRHLP